MLGNKKSFPHFLCDTWWYGMTERFSDKTFEKLARLRHDQGFTAVQVVVGIPPEIGPENKNASSIVGPAWNLKGELNIQYLEKARQRIQMLNTNGLSALIYGAWGQQIEWLGEERMKDWWKEIVKEMDDLDVMYCITGESDILTGEENRLLPDRSTDDFVILHGASFIHPRIISLGKRVIRFTRKSLFASKSRERRKKWSRVLRTVAGLTDKPLFIHPIPNITSEGVVENPELLSAVTVQTSHDIRTRRLLWQIPFSLTKDIEKKYINLEPWYEGINDKFGIEDQLYAYWASMMGGSYAYCYGAHGIWNAGDGIFLAHWGKQTIEDAMGLRTPELLGKSHKLFCELKLFEYKKIEVIKDDEDLIQITRLNKKSYSVKYIPDIRRIKNIPSGRLFNPSKGDFVKDVPVSGQLVILSR